MWRSSMQYLAIHLQLISKFIKILSLCCSRYVSSQHKSGELPLG
jgi:hypothetical protein